MPMPSVNDLQTMYGDWNPQAYLQAQSNADLERQYRESEYGRQQELTKQAGLETVFQEQNKPQLIEKQRLENQNLGYTGTGLQATNRKLNVEADLAEGTKQFKLDDAKRKELLAVTDHDLAMSDRIVEQLRRSLDPEENAMGEKLFQLTGIARAEKQKHAQAVELRKMQEDAANKRQAGSNATSIKVAEINQAGQDRRAATKAEKKGDALDTLAALQSGKVDPAKAAIALNAKAAVEQDPEMREMYLNLARIAETIHRQGPAPAGGGKLAVEGVNRTPPAPLATPEPRGNLSNVPKGPEKSLAKVQEMYPGVPPEKLKEAYKKKFGVDLQ